MAIDKITPIRLDKSSDYKLVPKTSMVDALNMLITEDDSDGGDGTTGNLGVLKNLKGNEVIEYVSGNGVGSGNAKIIGSVTDTKLKIVYFFVWSTDPLEHGVYAYDQLGKLPGGGETAGRIRRIHKSNLYKFPEHGFVKGNIVYTSQSRLEQGSGGPIKPGTERDFEKDTILYFTDNTNEPRKINVYMAMLGEDVGYIPADQIDFITACPKTPLTPIVFTWTFDSSKGVSNFKSGPGFQFAYQFISKDGVESAISPYSDIAFPSTIINQGANEYINHNINNTCALNIPPAGAEIESIRILARQFNNPELVVLDEVSNIDYENEGDNWSIDSRTYSFYNDRIVKGVSTNEVNKQFDNLPRKAQAQSIVDNRLMYGNYLEGFNNVNTKCTSDISFKERPEEFVDFRIKIIPAISESPISSGQFLEYINTGQGMLTASNKSGGYIIDCGEIPNNLSAGATISITLSVAPNTNFHVYQSTNSYHQSRHKGAFRPYKDPLIDYTESETYNGGEQYGNEQYGHQSLSTSGATWAKDNSFSYLGIPYSGDNKGVAGANGEDGAIQAGNEVPSNAPKWKTMYGSNIDTEGKEVCYGTSAANPLIIQGRTIEFSCVFTVNHDIDSTARAFVSSTVAQLLCGGPDAITWGGGVSTGFINVLSYNTQYDHNIDLQINNFDKYGEGTAYSKLVTSVIKKEEGYVPTATPIGNFIINKAKVEFGLERDQHYSTIESDSEMIRLVINRISDVETVTVVRKKFPNSPWVALTKDFLVDNFSESELLEHTSSGYPGFPLEPLGYNYTTGEAYYQTGYTDEIFPDAFSSGQVIKEETNLIEDFIIDYNGVIVGTQDEDNVVTIAGGSESAEGEGVAQNTQLNIDKYNELLFFGYLDFNQENNDFFRYNKSVYTFNQIANLYPNDPLLTELFPFSLLDGEGGMGGALSHDLFNSNEFIQNLSSLPRIILPRVMTTSGEEDGGYVQLRLPNIFIAGPEFTGTIKSDLLKSRVGFVNELYSGTGLTSGGGFSNNWGFTSPPRSFIPLMQGSSSEGLDLNDTETYPYSYPVLTPDTNNEESWPFLIDFLKQQSHIEVLDVSSTVLLGLTGEDRTFKTNANHDFGIIYYDERGRHGFVNHLETVYVPGYSSIERQGSFHGRNEIILYLEPPAPNWAHSYKIAYSKNTSVENFIQYSAGGAYIEPLAEDDINNNKIYVSLNYLQESPISYVADWGARTPEGGLSMFKYIDGVNQKLRVISSFTSEFTREYYNKFEFDIVDIVLLGETDNPLSTTPENEPWTQGEFVVLKNNSAAFGFDFASIVNDFHGWGDNCIIELYTPKKNIEEDERFYYEIGETYSINNPGTDSANHSVTDITLDKGDVWWRRVPVNFRKYNNTEGFFEDLIQNSVENLPNASSSNFKSYYLETETASDLFKADASLIGRPNIILEDAVETIREASITYSGKSNPNSSKINYSSFNLTLSNFKDLQEEFGDINYMCNMEGDVFVIQSDRCTLVPASKTLFSDVSGTDTVAASKSPLGQERVFAGRAGCDNNPESVVQVGAFVYFAHKNLGKVYRFNPSNGVQEISDQGMASYFRGVFKAAIDRSKDIGDFINYDDVRVVGGFDPVNEEYLLTVLDPLTYGVIPSGGGGNGGDFDGNGGDDSASSTTVNSLEQQVRNILEAILTTTKEDANGVETLMFDIADLPEALRDFYTGETDTLDPNNDGVFNANEVVGAAEIQLALQVGVQDLAAEISQSLFNNDLQIIHDAIADSTVPETVDGVVAYIDALELPDADALSFQTHISSIIMMVFNLMNILSNNKQSYSDFNSTEDGEEVLVSAQSPSEFMNLFGSEGRFPFEDLLQNATDVSHMLSQVQQIFAGGDSIGLESDTQTIYHQGEVWGGPSLNATADLQIDGAFFTEFKNNLGAIMSASESETYNTLDIAQQFIAESYISAIGTEANLNITELQVPTAIVNSLNQTFGVELTIDDVGTFAPTLISAIEQAYITGSANYNGLLPDFNAGILQNANSDLYDEIIDNYLDANSQLNAGLQSIIDSHQLTDEAGLLAYVTGLINNVTALNNFINQRVENVPPNASQAERLVLLGDYILNLATNDTALQTLLNQLELNTLSDLEGYIATLLANQGDGYSSLETALQAEGISIMQLRNLTQQIAALGDTETTLLMADLVPDGTLGTADLLLFLSFFGDSTNINYNQGYTGLDLLN